jgi:hypothetical protein
MQSVAHAIEVHAEIVDLRKFALIKIQSLTSAGQKATRKANKRLFAQIISQKSEPYWASLASKKLHKYF